MNDHDYVIKAVDLADGWEWARYSDCDQVDLDVVDGALWRNDFEDSYTPENIPRIFLDALAAQLVRQVDAALNDWRLLELFGGHTAVRAVDKELGQNNYEGHDLGACYGQGRTMNTIRAIVDSGVLQRRGTNEEV